MGGNVECGDRDNEVDKGDVFVYCNVLCLFILMVRVLCYCYFEDGSQNVWWRYQYESDSGIFDYVLNYSW